MLAFGYHVHNGFQLNYSHPSDKSIAYIQHRDTDLEGLEENEEDLKQHTHNDEKEPFFNEHLFDS